MTPPPVPNETAPAAPCLAGPPALVVSARHCLGPLAPWSTQTVQASVDFALANTASAAPAAVHLTLDPLGRDKDGAAVCAHLALDHNGEVLLQDSHTVTLYVPPGTTLRLRLRATGKLPPQGYRSRLRAHIPAVDAHLEVPITVRVTAHWGWAVGLMLMGLTVWDC